MIIGLNLPQLQWSWGGSGAGLSNSQCNVEGQGQVCCDFVWPSSYVFPLGATASCRPRAGQGIQPERRPCRAYIYWPAALSGAVHLNTWTVGGIRLERTILYLLGSWSCYLSVRSEILYIYWKQKRHMCKFFSWIPLFIDANRRLLQIENTKKYVNIFNMTLKINKPCWAGIVSQHFCGRGFFTVCLMWCSINYFFEFQFKFPTLSWKISKESVKRCLNVACIESQLAEFHKNDSGPFSIHNTRDIRQKCSFIHTDKLENYLLNWMSMALTHVHDPTQTKLKYPPLPPLQ